MSAPLATLRRCFEGAIPSAIANCANDGKPNATYVSQVYYVDEQHVALTYQFFDKTRENVIRNARATLQVVDPDTAAFRYPAQHAVDARRAAWLSVQGVEPRLPELRGRL